jgi:hypothetical protein
MENCVMRLPADYFGLAIFGRQWKLAGCSMMPRSSGLCRKICPRTRGAVRKTRLTRRGHKTAALDAICPCPAMIAPFGSCA